MNGHIFGPVPSRRLGRSLGIDMVPFKTCTYDCVYCQLGHTTCKTTDRKEWTPLEGVLAELEEHLPTTADYVTLSGSGEPTLHSRIGEAIDRIKGMTDVPVAVLTNGSLLWQAELRRELAGADLVIPSLDAGSPSTFEQVNCPHEDISFERLLDGLATFRGEFRGPYWLEVFLITGVTTSNAEVERLVRCVDRIGPDRVQLNTVTRPPAELGLAPVSRDLLDRLAGRFHPPAEVIAAHHDGWEETGSAGGQREVLDLLRRRPCTLDDVAHGLGMHRNEVVKHLESLAVAEQVRFTCIEGRWYYVAIR
ncbi:MAG: radical SAM protein [Pirellulales bacterium]|nr:radical SAM protein [Pirellulales bacterium]